MKVTKYEVRWQDLKPELCKERSVNYPNIQNLSRTEDVSLMMEEFFDLSSLVDERLYVIAVNSKLSVLGVFEVARGGTAFCSVPIPEIFRDVLLLAPHVSSWYTIIRLVILLLEKKTSRLRKEWLRLGNCLESSSWITLLLPEISISVCLCTAWSKGAERRKKPF